MSAVIRTVRGFDHRPGEAKEEKRVGGFLIEKSVPLPKRSMPAPIMEVVRALEVGESFAHKARVKTAEYRDKMPGRTFACRRVGNGYRIWRIK